ncbi:MAG: ArsR/SmtB family transcription factor [Mycobacteriales bacterium]
MTAVFKALADPTRQRLLDRLRAENGQTLGALCRDLALTRQGVTQHLAVLEAAGLVTTVRRGREKLHYLNPVPLHEIADRWIARFERPDLAALAGLKRSLEQETDPMDVITKPRLVYVTYLDTTPERVWAALTDPDQTAIYWRHRNVSGWTRGDSWSLRTLDQDGTLDRVGTILEVDPPRRLVHSWAAPADTDNPARHSRVTFDIEPAGDVVRLTLVHEDLPADEFDGANRGWALVLAGMKTYLETGRAMPWPHR